MLVQLDSQIHSQPLSQSSFCSPSHDPTPGTPPAKSRDNQNIRKRLNPQLTACRQKHLTVCKFLPGRIFCSPAYCCHLIGTPSCFVGGILLPSFLSGLKGASSLILSCLCKKLCSFTGLPLVAPGIGIPLLFPLLPIVGPPLPVGTGEVRCGIFSGKGC